MIDKIIHINFNFNTRLNLTILFISFLTLFSTAIFLKMAISYYKINKNTKNVLSKMEERLIRIRPFLPNDKNIGYLTDEEGVLNYYLAENVLAPYILIDSPQNVEYIIGDFYSRRNINYKNYKVIRDLDDGLLLLKRSR